MKFTGHERDFASSAGAGDDLDYMHARHESPVTGRFLSVDPSRQGQDPKSPVSWNRYVYGGDNPLKYVDHDGRVYRCPQEGCPEWMTPHTFWQRLEKGFIEASMLPGPMALEAGPEVAGSLLGSWFTKAGQLLGRLFGGGGEGTAAAVNLSRALRVADLGIQGSVTELKGTFSVAKGAATVRIDLIQGEIKNPLSIISNLIKLAETNGATTLRIEGTVANEKLLAILAQRYGMQTEGATDYIVIKLGQPK